jgi:hypothetical protein
LAVPPIPGINGTKFGDGGTHGTSSQVVPGYVALKQPSFGNEARDIALRQCGGAAGSLGETFAWFASVARGCARAAFEARSAPAKTAIALAVREREGHWVGVDLGDDCLIGCPFCSCADGSKGEYREYFGVVTAPGASWQMARQ